MSNIDQTEATNILKALFNAQAYTAPTSVYAAVDTSTTAPTATGFGSEASGQGYARALLTMATAAAGSVTNSAAANFTNMPAGTYSYIELFTTLTLTTRRLWYGSLATPKTLASGDTLSIAASQLTATLG